MAVQCAYQIHSMISIQRLNSSNSNIFKSDIRPNHVLVGYMGPLKSSGSWGRLHILNAPEEPILYDGGPHFEVNLLNNPQASRTFHETTKSRSTISQRKAGQSTGISHYTIVPVLPDDIALVRHLSLQGQASPGGNVDEVGGILTGVPHPLLVGIAVLLPSVHSARPHIGSQVSLQGQ